MTVSDLLEEFNVVIDTREGLSELRSLILGLAIRGKLVPQDPNDEPASELVKKINEEQSRLFENDKIRKPKELDIVTTDETPFVIPTNWIWERMGNISDVIRGITFPGSEKKKEKNEGDILCLKTSNVQEQLDWSDVIYVDESFVKREDQYLRNNDIVISMANSYELVGKVALAQEIPEKCSFGGFLSVIRPFLFDPLYYFYLLRSSYVQSAFRESSSQTVNIANISLKVMLPLLMPLPPLDEQNRIVAKIETLFAEVDELEAKLEAQTKLDDKLQLAVNAEVQQAPDTEASKTAWSFITSNFETLYHTPESIDNLKKNILNEAVRGRLVPQDPNDEPASELLKKIKAEKQRLYEEGEIRKPKALPPVTEDEIPFEIPESWEWVRLGDISTTKGGKRVPKGFSLTTETTKYIYLRVSDMQKGTIIDSDLHYIDAETHEQIQKYKISKNDIYMTIVGATIGKCGLIPERFSGSNLTENAVKITPLLLGKNFLYQLLDMPLSQDQFIDKTKQVGVQKMAIFRLKNTFLPLPPLQEQHRIVQRIEELFAICDAYKAKLEQREKVNERLVKGLVQEVLEGV